MIDVARFAADSLAKQLKDVWDRHTDDCDDAVAYNNVHDIATQAIETIGTLIDPEPDPHDFSPDDLRKLVRELSRSYAEFVINADLEMLLNALFDKFPALVHHKGDGETDAEYFAKVGMGSIKQFLNQREF